MTTKQQPVLAIIPPTPNTRDKKDAIQDMGTPTKVTDHGDRLRVPSDASQNVAIQGSSSQRRSRSSEPYRASISRRSTSSSSSFSEVFAQALVTSNDKDKGKGIWTVSDRHSLPTNLSKPLPTIPPSIKKANFSTSLRTQERSSKQTVIRFHDTNRHLSEFGVIKESGSYSDGDMVSISSIPEGTVQYRRSRSPESLHPESIYEDLRPTSFGSGRQKRSTSFTSDDLFGSNDYESATMMNKYRDYTTWSKRRQRISIGPGGSVDGNFSGSWSGSRSTTPTTQPALSIRSSIAGSLMKSLRGTRNKKYRESDASYGTNLASTLYDERTQIPPRAPSRIQSINYKLPPNGQFRSDKTRFIPPGAILFLFGFIIWPLWWIGGFIYPRPKKKPNVQSTWSEKQSSSVLYGRSWATWKKFKRNKLESKKELIKDETRSHEERLVDEFGTSPNLTSGETWTDVPRQSVMDCESGNMVAFDDEWTEQDENWRLRNRYVGCTLGIALTIAVIVLLVIYARKENITTY